MRSQIAGMIFLVGVSMASPLWGADTDAKSTPAQQQDAVPKQWLDRQISVEQAEAQHMVEGTPFGARNGDWKRLKASLEVGDNILTYCSPFESFKAHAGRCGIAVVRNDRVVMQLVTMMN